MKYFVIFSTLFIVNQTSFGQISASSEFIKGLKSDAEKIISAYIHPLEKSMVQNGQLNGFVLFSNGLNQKWHFGFGLDIQTTFVNKKDQTYNVNALNLEEFELADSSEYLAQTIAGSDESIDLQTQQNVTVASTSYPFYKSKPMLTLPTPEGYHLNLFPYPKLHLFAEKNGNVITLSGVPPLHLSTFSLGTFDFAGSFQLNMASICSALKDNFLHYYLTMGYNFNSLVYDLDVKPSESALTLSFENDRGPYEEQYFQLITQTIPISIKIALPLTHFTIAAGLNYAYSMQEFNMIGNFPIYKVNAADSYQVIVRDLKDPIHLSRNAHNLSGAVVMSYRNNHFAAGINYHFSNYHSLGISLGFIF